MKQRLRYARFLHTKCPKCDFTGCNVFLTDHFLTDCPGLMIACPLYAASGSCSGCFGEIRPSAYVDHIRLFGRKALSRDGSLKNLCNGFFSIDKKENQVLVSEAFLSSAIDKSKNEKLVLDSPSSSNDESEYEPIVLASESPSSAIDTSSSSGNSEGCSTGYTPHSPVVHQGYFFEKATRESLNIQCKRKRDDE